MKNDAIEKSVGTCVMAFHELMLHHQGKDAKMESTLTIEELNKSQEHSPLKFSLNCVDMKEIATPQQTILHDEIDVKKKR